MYTILSDAYTSRRQRMCHIIDGEPILVWSGKHVEDALLWLVEQGQVEVRLAGETHTFNLKIEMVSR